MQPGTYVLVTTAYRGIFAGEFVSQDEALNKVTLRNARAALKWATTKGFLELAETGPNSKSRIGAVAPELNLYAVTSIATCTEEAKAAWQK